MKDDGIHLIWLKTSTHTNTHKIKIDQSSFNPLLLPNSVCIIFFVNLFDELTFFASPERSSNQVSHNSYCLGSRMKKKNQQLQQQQKNSRNAKSVWHYKINRNRFMYFLNDRTKPFAFAVNRCVYTLCVLKMAHLMNNQHRKTYAGFPFLLSLHPTIRWRQRI